MIVTYLTGTRYPGSALKQFLPDYLDLLVQRGKTLLTTNKPGVDVLIVDHCDQHHVPLQVIEFACDSGDDFRNRRVKATSEAVQVQRVVSPSWLHFRHLADKVDKMTFFHAAKTRGRCYGLPTIKAFELACKRRGIEDQQLIIYHNPHHLESTLSPEIRDLLDPYPQVVWQREKHADLLQQIGQHISQGQELWHHKRRIKAYRGLYQ